MQAEIRNGCLANSEMHDDKNKDIKNPSLQSPAGIIADSHGHFEKIHAALQFLADRGCGYLIHLGDICDSTRPQTAEACVRPLQKLAVDAIRGNNDHQIVVNDDGQGQSMVAPDVLDYLKKLPLVRQYQNAMFTHSLPFASELGLSSMVGVMGNLQLHQFFRTYPQGLLFRGHSHSPYVHFESNNQVISQELQANQKIELIDRLPCVVTCGALTRGFCMMWTPGQDTIECLRFE
jgi:predicted phosphodiesterase